MKINVILDMKKIEFFVSDEKLKTVDKIRKKETFTRAELMRRALDLYIQLQTTKSAEDAKKTATPIPAS
jgi:metal-responsive CopG/Arc/MetJ family transcriptional regulator